MTTNIFPDGVFILQGVSFSLEDDDKDYFDFEERTVLGVFASAESAIDFAAKSPKPEMRVEHWESLGDERAKNVWENLSGTWFPVVVDFISVELPKEDDNDLLSLF